MPKAARDALNNKGKTDVYTFDPNDVVLVAKDGEPLFDERAQNDFKESLVQNMMLEIDGVTIGVIEPTSGRRNRETGQVEIIDGRQRTIALREVNRRRKKKGLDPIWLPVHLKRAGDALAMGMLISANEHRTEDSAGNKALKVQRYLALGRDEKEVAVLLGVSESTVKNLVKLLDAPAAVRKAEATGKITTSDAYRLSREEPEKAKEMLGELLTQAPRTPGKKRSKNAKKAREIVRAGKKSKAAEAKSEARAEKKAENEVAEAIAAWIEATWNEKGDWAGAPSQIPAGIRSGEWRKYRAAAAEAAE